MNGRFWPLAPLHYALFGAVLNFRFTPTSIFHIQINPEFTRPLSFGVVFTLLWASPQRLEITHQLFVVNPEFIQLRKLLF